MKNVTSEGQIAKGFIIKEIIVTLVINCQSVKTPDQYYIKDENNSCNDTIGENCYPDVLVPFHYH
jgi:hypothetical protein